MKAVERSYSAKLLVTVTAAWLVLSVAPALAEEKPDAAGVELGRGYFLAYCASCHGADARGDGPVAAALASKPLDLTRIAARRDGKFPPEEIAGYITGKSATPAHGTREMPVWGTHLAEAQGEGEATRLIVRGQLRALLDYLESIQR